MGMNEMSLRHCEILAIEQINARGELPNVDLVPVVKDGPPDLILSTINGDSNLYFDEEYYESGGSPEKSPIVATV
jgi:hypothetical protein